MPSIPAVVEDERVLIRAQGEDPGPAFLAIGSLHGNEPSGRDGIARVAHLLREVQEEHGYALRRGDFLGLAGNLPALRLGLRYIDTDLNRGWNMQCLERIVEKGPTTSEDREMLDLFSLIQDFRAQARDSLSFIDLHSTSGESPPFASVGKHDLTRELASSLPVPTVFGIDTHLRGTFLECMKHFDFTGIVYEGGQHDNPRTVDHNEAAIWLILKKLGLVDKKLSTAVGERLQWARATLDTVSAHLPNSLQIESRYALESSSGFKMRPGFESFQIIREGELLATHRGREIRSSRDGMILMPLYQPQGDEAFFVMKVL